MDQLFHNIYQRRTSYKEKSQLFKCCQTVNSNRLACNCKARSVQIRSRNDEVILGKVAVADALSYILGINLTLVMTDLIDLFVKPGMMNENRTG